MASSPLQLLIFPFPAQGHMIPLLDLANHLSAGGDVAITIIVTPKNLPLISPLLSRNPSILPLVLPFQANSSSLPPGVEHVRELRFPATGADLMLSLSSLRPAIHRWIVSNRPAAIIYDFFLGWVHHLATDLGVRSVAFFSSGAFLTSVIDHLFAFPPNQTNARVLFDSIPGSPTFRYPHLPSLFRRYAANASDEKWEFVRESMVANASSWGLVFNTFDALEDRYLTYLKTKYSHNRIWAVGPISPMLPADGRGGHSSVPPAEITAWLDAHPKCSVIFVCFGSQFRLSQAQAIILANALEASQTSFVWCIGDGKLAGDEGSVVPDGFNKEGRGLVVCGWAPQVMILNHDAVGSFVTHCGWNSVLEGITAGVVLLTWPMEADQFVNVRLLVDELGVAMPACEGGTEALPDADDLARVMVESVTEGTWTVVRARAKQMARMAAEAVSDRGSSSLQLEKLLQELGGTRSKVTHQHHE